LDTSDLDGLPEGAVFTLEEASSILKTTVTTIDDMVRSNRIRSLVLGDQTRIARRTLVALLRGMSEEEFDMPLAERSGDGRVDHDS
jgi:excisionase family DNA binding protein